MSEVVRYQGQELPRCQIPLVHGEDKPYARFDGKTTAGPWAYMCSGCMTDHGVGLGTGRGQLLHLDIGREYRPGDRVLLSEGWCEVVSLRGGHVLDLVNPDGERCHLHESDVWRVENP